jgi:hypothetical protein
MGPTTDLRREIENRFIPAMTANGFACDVRHAPQFLTFRRIAADSVYVADIQWDKYARPRFVVNFGKCGAAGVIIRGERIAPEDVFPHSTPIWGRLLPGSGRTTAGWFRQDRPMLERIVTWSARRPPAEVVATLLALFPEVEEFWQSGQAGRHSRILPSRRYVANADQALT